jgi:lactoylglutathione lyase
MKIEINHVLLRTADIEGMIQFFKQSLNLENGYRPPFDFPGAWLWDDDKPLIHLSEISLVDKEQLDYLRSQKVTSEMGTGTIDHIAFSGSDYKELIERLKHYKMDYFERTVPLTDEYQVFVEGPEGLRIEIQFDELQISQLRTEK